MQCERDGSRFPVHLHQDYLQRPAKRTCKVIGDRGKIEADVLGLTVKAYDGSGQIAESHEFHDFQRNRLFLQETQRFLASIESGGPPVVSLRDGFQSVRMALAARESLETGALVSLSDPIN
jgi:predicted dehydrogenase